jgi:hypothetical protein
MNARELGVDMDFERNKPGALLAMALGASAKGYAILERRGADARLSWANASFSRLAGIGEDFAQNGLVSELWSSLNGAPSDFTRAIESGHGWAGCLGTPELGKLHARLETVSGTHAALWLERDGGADMLRERLADALRKVEEVASETTGQLNGPKSFWRSVGAVWTVCSRNELHVTLGLVSMTPRPGSSVSEIEASAKAALGRSFRRTSDVVGRLGLNSLAVFVVGQSAEQSRARFEKLVAELSDVAPTRIGLACGVPAHGSSTQTIRALAKNLLDMPPVDEDGGIEFAAF